MTKFSADRILVQHHEIEEILGYFGHVGRGGLALAISLLWTTARHMQPYLPQVTLPVR